MNLPRQGRLQGVLDRLDIRPHEARDVALSTAGAFLLLAFVVLARSMREALYITDFEVRNLPYVIAAVALLSLPAVGWFAKLLTRHRPLVVLRLLKLIMIVGLIFLWVTSPYLRVTAIGFYIWTAIGGMLLASGFWVLTSECFALRGAKRLFGVISAGGTAGAMVMGLSLGFMTDRLPIILLVPVLVGLLTMLMVIEGLLCRGPRAAARGAVKGESGSIREHMRVVRGSPYLKTMAGILFLATVASTIVDYQFKEIARANITGEGDLAGFFGAFYGWTGGIALGIQLLITARIMATGGVALGLAVLPVLLLLGAGGILLLPGLMLITAVRGVDYSLRKSLLRPLFEFLYVPLPSLVRRKTKTFIDSVVDSVAEGTGAAVVFIWVTTLEMSSRYLSALVAVVCLSLIVLGRRMGRLYFATIVDRLKEGEARAEMAGGGAVLQGGALLTASFSRIDIQNLLLEGAPAEVGGMGSTEEPAEAETPAVVDPSVGLESTDNRTVLGAMRMIEKWEDEQITVLMRLLARDSICEHVVETLVGLEERALPLLTEALVREETDFVIRRRIPRVLAVTGGPGSEEALLRALLAHRFEVRYRAAIALVRLRSRPASTRGRMGAEVIWQAIRAEVGRGKPVWEMQRLLDGVEAEGDDDMVVKRVGARGELSLEHTFRLLSLVLDPEPVKAAFQGIVHDDENLKGYALEYLEQVLPQDVRTRLWLFIGDVSEYRKAKSLRPVQQVVADLCSSRATLFGKKQERDALRRMIDERLDRDD